MDFLNAMFFELDIAPSDNLKAWIDYNINSYMASYDAYQPYGLYNVNDVIYYLS